MEGRMPILFTHYLKNSTQGPRTVSSVDCYWTGHQQQSWDTQYNSGQYFGLYCGKKICFFLHRAKQETEL